MDSTDPIGSCEFSFVVSFAAMPPPATLEQQFKNSRPRLSPEELRARQLVCKARWRDNNRAYFNLQCATLKARPESKAREKERLRAKREAFIAAGGVIRPRGRPPKARSTSSPDENKMFL